MSGWREVLNQDFPVYKTISGSQLRGFLNSDLKRLSTQYLFDDSQELSVHEGRLAAKPDHSLSLLVYSALAPNLIVLGSNYESRLQPIDLPSEFTPHPETFFNGTSLRIPKNSAIDAKFRSFEEWTSVNEVRHISQWLATALKAFLGSELRVSTEVEIPLEGERRPGRLDVVGLLGCQLLCFEAKTSMSDAIKDRRFVEQIPKYKREISETLEDSKYQELDASLFLVVGGSEQDLRQEKGLLKPSPVGQKLVELCLRHEIKMVTANAVWQILAARLTLGVSSAKAMEVFTSLYSNDNYLGVTSAGFLTVHGQVDELSLF
jgi:hypothetical protein